MTVSPEPYVELVCAITYEAYVKLSAYIFPDRSPPYILEVVSLKNNTVLTGNTVKSSFLANIIIKGTDADIMELLLRFPKEIGTDFTLNK